MTLTLAEAVREIDWRAWEAHANGDTAAAQAHRADHELLVRLLVPEGD